MQEYNFAWNTSICNFEGKTSSRNVFDITDVDKDGACMYHCMALFIFRNIKFFARMDIMKDYIEILKNGKNITDDVLANPKRLLEFITSLAEEDFDKVDDELSFYIQKLLKNWCVENSDRIIANFEIPLSTWILMTHEEISSMQEYNQYYDVYAGDPDFILIPSDEKYKSGKKKGEYKMKKEEIPERWGGITELYAFNHLFETWIYVYNLKRFDRRNGKVFNCTDKSKYARFSQYSHLLNINEPRGTMELLLTNSNSPHYKLLNRTLKIELLTPKQQDLKNAIDFEQEVY